TPQLSGNLQPRLVSQPGTSYGYTFGSPVVGTIRDEGFEWAVVKSLVDNLDHGEQVSNNTKDWTFTDSTTNSSWHAGIVYNTSPVTSGNPPAPQGLQAAFITGDSSISQTVSLAPGRYVLSFKAAQRAGQQLPQSLKVLVDGEEWGTIKPRDTSYGSHPITFDVKDPGKHLITFLGTQNADSTVLLDEVSIAIKK